MIPDPHSAPKAPSRAAAARKSMIAKKPPAGALGVAKKTKRLGGKGKIGLALAGGAALGAGLASLARRKKTEG